MNWKKYGSTAQSYIQKKHFSISYLNWGKTRGLLKEQHSKIPKSLSELRKTWNFSLRPTFKSHNFESVDELGKSIP